MKRIRSIKFYLHLLTTVNKQLCRIFAKKPAMDIQQITAESLRELREPLRKMIEEGRVFAVQRSFGSVRCAKISMVGNRIHLHVLKNGQPPPDALAIDFNDIMRLVDPSSKMAFLELTTSTAALGQMVIRLSPDTPGARNFAMLCSGEMGPSYIDTKLFQVYHRGKKYEYVGGGDYEYNNGEGGRALISGLQLGKEYERPWLAGTVRGFWGLGNTVSGQFFINTKDHSVGVCSPAFGIVEEGLDVLREALRLYPDITEVSVKDCGIVLTFSLSC